MSLNTLPHVCHHHWVLRGRRTCTTTIYFGLSLVTIPTNDAFVHPLPAWYFPLKAICEVPDFPPRVNHGIPAILNKPGLSCMTENNASLSAVAVSDLNI